MYTSPCTSGCYSRSKNVLLSIIIRPKFWTPHTHLYPGRFCSKSNHFILGSEMSPPKSIAINPPSPPLKKPSMYALAKVLFPDTVPRCVDINECISTPCRNGGTCVNSVGSYTCTCPKGWVGKLCEHSEYLYLG